MLTGPPSYKDRVDSALAECMQGCTYVALHELSRLIGPANDPGGLQSPEDEQIAITALTALLRRPHHRGTRLSVPEQYCMLEGLAHNDRWRELFRCEEDAYSFVILLSIAYANNHTTVHSVVRPWLPRDETELPFAQRDLARAFFGEVWCNFVYDSSDEWITLAQLIKSTRPQFLPGRLTSDPAGDAVDLPELTC
jgi:hypothetical protein